MGLVETIERNTITVGTLITVTVDVTKEYTYPLFDNSTPLTTPASFYPF